MNKYDYKKFADYLRGNIEAVENDEPVQSGEFEIDRKQYIISRPCYNLQAHWVSTISANGYTKLSAEIGAKWCEIRKIRIYNGESVVYEEDV